MYFLIFAALILVVAFSFTHEGMQCSSFLDSFKEAASKGMQPKPFCANGFPLDPETDCTPFDTTCDFGFHKVTATM